MINKKITLLLAAFTSTVAFAQFPSDYKGTPYKGPHNVPGTLQAEDFDEGGEGISYHDVNTNPFTGGYRPGVTVCVENNYNIGFTDNGEWLNYTIEVAEDGAYLVKTYCCGPNGNGSFHLEVDGKVVTRVQKAPVTSGWTVWKNVDTTIQLTKGKHLFRWYTYGGMNVDYFEFTKTGDYNPNDILGNFNYPITKESHNPLFVNFDSPMFDSNAIGSFYAADPSAHVWNIDGKDRLYIYASHDMEPARGCDRMDRYHVFSTDDMVNWTDHGEIFNSGDVEWGRPEGGFMWAPDCVYKNGKYYYYFPHPTGSEWNETWHLGVAVSDNPATGFKQLGYMKAVPWTIDPCVFIDDDGQAYLYLGGGGTCYGGKLKDNMTEVEDRLWIMNGLEDFHEGTWVHKYNGKYYLSYADNHGNDGNQLCYAISDSPLGPWKDMGPYLLPTGCYTSHGSIVEYNNKWYAFYHTSNYSGVGELRSACFDELKYNDDGSIQVVRNWGEAYGEPVHITLAGTTIEAETYNTGYHSGYFKKTLGQATHSNNRPADDVSIANDGNTYYAKGLEGGEWLRYSCKVDEPENYDIIINVRGNGSFHLSINGSDVSGTKNVNSNTWQEVKISGKVLKASTEYIELRMNGGTLDFDNIKIVAGEVYQGRPYKNHFIPGKIEAEDFDLGGEGVAFKHGEHHQDYTYRTDAEGKVVDMEGDGKGRINLSWMGDQKMFRYTFEVKEDGKYIPTARVAAPYGGGWVKITYLGEEYKSNTYSGNAWDDYKVIDFPKTIEFQSGMRSIEVVANVNLDWINFEKVATDIKGVTSDENTPVVFTTADGITIANYTGNADIYTFSGVKVYSSKNVPSKVSLKSGMYIVALGEYKTKVLVNKKQN